MEEAEFHHVVEWNIENFSCWSRGLHDKSIKSPQSKSFTLLTLELFPKGIRRQEDRMAVRITHDSYFTLPGALLSFVSSDGSLLCTQLVDLDEDQRVIELPPGPNFEDVVAQIRRNEADHKDRLTLRLKMMNCMNSVEHLSTTIDVVDASFQIPIHMLDPSVSSSGEIAWIKYPYDYSAMEKISLKVSNNGSDCSKICITFIPERLKRITLVFTRLSVLNEKDDVVRTEVSETLFPNGMYYPWMFSNSLTKEDVKKDNFSVIFRFKIVHYMYSTSVGLSFGSDEAILRIPSNKVSPPGTKVRKEILSKSFADNVSDHQPENTLKGLSKELMAFCKDQDFSDFQLKCGTVKFPVQRNILTAGSPVLKTMLTSDSTLTDCMDIMDLNPSTLARFLAFLYTGAVEDLQKETALQLYYAADKYLVPTLKKECANFLSANVSISNVCDVLYLAHEHQDDHLTSVAHEFISGNYNEVLRSEEWKKWMEDDPRLAVKTLTHLADKNYVTVTKTQ